ncbi:uncharacterized protein A1O9_10678 [Exophiala aquamarina CBS 119918]|uniref:Uncharacterized protein n=1 Tax=Exophiala aquamarina CBS 119918 TaxID=1182545 RepID=A0A072PCE5_9EURO|nr:uncharacterized protein A1O9_10678 [Exophiala aquamarina CBS 119918]KEF53230.1 hypothetical protein A1O9_10678 [Exophiala aquamarina CBS 119918]
MPKINGIDEAGKAFPDAFEHSKAYRSPNMSAGKVQNFEVVLGNISASDLISDLFMKSSWTTVSLNAPTERNEQLESVYNLPDVQIQAPVTSTRPTNSITVTFEYGTAH